MLKMVLITVCFYAEVMMSNIIQVSFVQSLQDNVYIQKKKKLYIQATNYYVKAISRWMTT